MTDITCFTDGSTIGNGSVNAKGGFGVIFPDYPQYDHGKSVKPATNNRCEYTAVISAIETCDQINPDRKRSVVIYTDSMLLINSLTKWLTKWKRNNYRKADGNPVLNLDLIKILEEQMQNRHITFKHVKAHTGLQTWEAIYNDKVDKLAKASVE